jgi:hypothetical protein
VFDLKGISPSAHQFMRTYIAALRRDHDTLQTVLDLMDPENLGVVDVIKATRMARQLNHEHAEFEKTINALPGIDKFFRRTKQTTGPSFETLSELFSLSFFSVLYADKTKSTKKPKTDAGVFSGKPEEWHATLKALQNNPLPLDDMFSACFSALAKLFPKFNNFQWPGNIAKDAPMNFWPPKAAEPPDEGPFKWLSDEEDPDEDDYYE